LQFFPDGVDGVDGAFLNSIFLMQSRRMLSVRHEHATAAKPENRARAKTLARIVTRLALGAWFFSGAWSLVLGTFSGRTRPTFEFQISNL
jgi:hypothetical protein